MALGKGLSALIPEKTNPVSIEGTTKNAQDGLKEQHKKEGDFEQQYLDVSLIKDNRFQPRQNYDDAKLDELVASIQTNGLLQPIVVRAIEQGFEVIAGERRLKAARKAGLKKIPVVIKQATDKEMLVLALVENLQREELNPVEKAESYQRLVDEFSFTQQDVANAVGKDRATIANLLRLLKLPKEIKQAVFEGKISEGHARALLAVEEPNAQRILFLEIIQKKLSVREVEEKVKNVVGDKPLRKAKRKALQDPEITAVEEELRGVFGTKVQIFNKRGNKGKVVIEYYSLNDFDRIMAVVKAK